MKFCIAGLGSIGRRHLRNLHSLAKDRGISITVEAFRSCGNLLAPEEELISRVCYSEAELSDDYDAVFICNPTALHYETIRAFSQKTDNMFIEKPVFDRTDLSIEELGLREDGVYYVACPLRYTSVLQWIKEYTEKEKIYSVRAICSTYLPDWRPGMDYRQTYSAHKEMGGGVSIDLIHEWDYLCWLFGTPQELYSLQGKYSNLEIDSEDIALYIARYPDKLVSLYLDYFGQSERREVELYTPDEVIVGDLRKQEIRFVRDNKRISLAEERDAYQKRELDCFIDMIMGVKRNENDIERALQTMRIAKGEI